MTTRLTVLAALVLCSSIVPAFAPPPPPPPKSRPPNPQELTKIPGMVGRWTMHNIDRYCSDKFYPPILNITAADASHIVMNGQTLKVTNIKTYDVLFRSAAAGSFVPLDIDVAPNGFRLEGYAELEYFPLDPVPGSCHYSRFIVMP